MVDQSISDLGNSEPGRDDPAAVAARLGNQGFAFVDGTAMRAWLGEAGLADWDGFARSWEDLGPDRFMADGGTYRKRRYACLQATADGLHLKPPEPHYQTLANNPLNGGVERVFAPVEAHIALHAASRAVIETCGRIFEDTDPSGRQPRSWHIEMHQFRIEARSDASGHRRRRGSTVTGSTGFWC